MNKRISDLPQHAQTRVFKWKTEADGNRFLVVKGRLSLWHTEEERQRVVGGLSRLNLVKKVIHLSVEAANPDQAILRYKTENGDQCESMSLQNLRNGDWAGRVVRVSEVGLRTFRRSQAVSSVVSGLSYLGSLLSTPFCWLYRAIVGTKHEKFISTLPGGAVNHRTTKPLSPETMLPQLGFVAKMFARADQAKYFESEGGKSGAQMVAETLEEAVTIGKDWRKNHVKPSKRAQLLCTQRTVELIKKAGHTRPVVIPIGRGEGKDFVQHFLIFRKIQGGNEFEVSDVCLHSPSSTNTKLYSTTTFRVGGENKLEPLIVGLFNLAAVAPCASDEEKELSGPRVEDKELLRYLHEAHLGATGGAEPVHPVRLESHVMPSRDPVRLLFELVKQMGIGEREPGGAQARGFDPKALENIQESKRTFYEAYVNELVRFFDEESGSMSTVEQSSVLQTIRYYAEHKVRAELRTESGSEVCAEEAVRSLLKQVDSRLKKLEKTTEEDDRVRRNLDAPVEIFTVLLQGSIAEGLKLQEQEDVQLAKATGGMRVTHEQFTRIEELSEHLRAGRANDSVEAMGAVLADAERFLEAGEADSAYSVAFRALEVLPAPRTVDNQRVDCWEQLTFEQLEVWIQDLRRLSAISMESALRSGQLPLLPRHYTAFYTKLPLLMRLLYDRYMERAQFDQEYIDYVEELLDPEQQDFAALRTHARLFQEERHKEIEKELKNKYLRIKQRLQGLLKDQKALLERIENETCQIPLRPQRRHAMPNQLGARPETDQEYQEYLVQRGRDVANWETLRGQRVVDAKRRRVEIEEELQRVDQRRMRALALSKGVPVPTTSEYDQEPLPIDRYGGDPRKDSFLNWLEEQILGKPDPEVSDFLQAALLSFPAALANRGPIANLDQQNPDRSLRSIAALARIRGFDKKYLALAIAKIHGVKGTIGVLPDFVYLRLHDYSQTTGEDKLWDEDLQGCFHYLRELQSRYSRRGLNQRIVDRDKFLVNLPRDFWRWQYHVDPKTATQIEIGLRGADRGLGWTFGKSPQGNGEEESKYEQRLIDACRGVTATPHAHLVPEQLRMFRELEEAMKILNGEPDRYLRRWHSLSLAPQDNHGILRYFQQAGSRVCFGYGEDKGRSHLVLTPDPEKPNQATYAVNGSWTDQLAPTNSDSQSIHMAISSIQAMEAIGRTALRLDDERAVLDQDRAPFPELQKKPESFLLSQTAVVKGRDDVDHHELSSLSVRQVFNAIMQLEDPLVDKRGLRYVLWNRVFQHGVLREALLGDRRSVDEHALDTQFFIDLGIALRQGGAFYKEIFDKKGENGELTYLFLILMSTKIRKMAGALLHDLEQQGVEANPDTHTKIANLKAVEEALPEIDEQIVSARFNTAEVEKKNSALFVLAYYCENLGNTARGLGYPITLEPSSWKNIFEAVFYLIRSQDEGGHSGLQLHYLRMYREKLLPLLRAKFNSDPSYQQAVLALLPGNGVVRSYCEKEGSPYVFIGRSAQGSSHTLDLQTGDGFGFLTAISQRVRMTRELEDLIRDSGCRLYALPKYVELLERPNRKHAAGVQGRVNIYQFPSPHAEGCMIQLEVTETHVQDQAKLRTKLRIYQKIGNKRYLFQKMPVSKSSEQEFFRLYSSSGNYTLEQMINMKGVWVAVDDAGKPDFSQILLARFHQDITARREPIRLTVQGRKLLYATIGSGSNQRYVLSGLQSADVPLLPFRDTVGMLLFSHDGKRVTEMHFPAKEGDEPLILVRSSKDEWILKGQEGWSWDIRGNIALEERFGKDYRSFVLPLMNKTTGEKRWMVFPYQIGRGGKRGEESILLRTPVDFLKGSGIDIDEMMDLLQQQMQARDGLPIPDGMGAGDVLAALQLGIQAAGGVGGVQDIIRRVNPGNGAAADQVQQVLHIMNAVTAPTPLELYEGPRGMTSSHACFLYLAMKAAGSKQFSQASYYLDLLTTTAAETKTAEEFEQLQQMLVRFVVMTFIDCNTSRSSSQIAYMLRLMATVFRVSDRLSSSFKQDLFGLSLSEMVVNREGLRLPDGLTMGSLMQLVASLLYGKYQQSLQNSKARSKLEGDRLILTEDDERAVGANVVCCSLAYTATLLDAVIAQALKIVGDQQAAKPLVKVLTAFFGEPVIDLPKPQRDELPTEAEVSRMFNAMLHLRQSETFSSVEEMHAKYGKEPKWETVLSNLWLYVRWIYETDLRREDLSFLFHHVPSTRQYSTEVNIARRLLLLMFEEKGAFRERLLPFMESLGCVEKAWLGLSLDGEREKMARYLSREFQKEPTLWSLQMSMGYRQYVAFLRWLRPRWEKLDSAALFRALSNKMSGFPEEDFFPETEIEGGQVVPRRTSEEKFQEHFVQFVVEGFLRPVRNRHQQGLFMGPVNQEGTGPVNYQAAKVLLPKKVSAKDDKRRRDAENAFLAFQNGLYSMVQSLVTPLNQLSRIFEHLGLDQQYTDFLGDLGNLADIPEELLQLTAKWRRPITTFLLSYTESQDRARAQTQLGEFMAFSMDGFGLQKFIQQAQLVAQIFENDPSVDISGLSQGWQFFYSVIQVLLSGEQSPTPLSQMLPRIAVADEGGETREVSIAQLISARSLPSLLGMIAPAIWKPLAEEAAAAMRSGDSREWGCVMAKALTSRLDREVAPAVLVERKAPAVGDFGCNPVLFDSAEPSIDTNIYFKKLDNRSRELDGKADRALYYTSLQKPEEGREKHYLESVEAGITRAVAGLKERTVNTLDRAKLINLAKVVDNRFDKTMVEKNDYRQQMIDFACTYQERLGLTHVFVGKRKIDEDFVIQSMVKLYEVGSLNRFGDGPEEAKITGWITRYLYASTELMQLKSARELLRNLYRIRDRKNVEQATDWCGMSQQLKEALEGGTDRKRYLAQNGVAQFEDPSIGRAYLCFDYHNGFVTRELAREVVEAILHPPQTEDGQAEVKRKLHILRMGLGKTSFISPLVAAELVRIKKRPICMTTPVLVAQLADNLGPRAHRFVFDLKYGFGSLDEFSHQRKFHERVCGMDPNFTDDEARLHIHGNDGNAACQRGRLNDGNKQKRNEEHLDRLIQTLTNLEAEGRYVVTTPSDLAALRNKRVMLQEQISRMEACEERTQLFRLLVRVKRIEQYFAEGVIIPDEDVCMAVNTEHNVAQGEKDRFNPIRFDMAEKFMLDILGARPVPQNKEADQLGDSIDRKRKLIVDLAREAVDLVDEDAGSFAGWLDSKSSVKGCIADSRIFAEESPSEKRAAGDFWNTLQAVHYADRNCLLRQTLKQLAGLMGYGHRNNIQQIRDLLNKLPDSQVGIPDEDLSHLEFLRSLAEAAISGTYRQSQQSATQLRKIQNMNELDKAALVAEAKRQALGLITTYEARQAVGSLRDKLLNNDLRSITNFKEELRPLAQLMARDHYYWKTSWGFVSWPTEESDIQKVAAFLIGDVDEAPACLGQWSDDLPPERQEHLCAVAALRTYFASFEIAARVNPHLSRGLGVDGVTPVPYKDGKLKENTFYSTEAEYIMHMLLLYLRGQLPFNERLFDDIFSQIKADDTVASPRNHSWKWMDVVRSVQAKMGAILINGQQFQRPYPVVTGIASGNKGEYLAAHPAVAMQLNALCFRERLFLARLALQYVDIFRNQVHCATQELTISNKEVHMLSGTGKEPQLGLGRDPRGYDSSQHVDFIFGETALSFKDLDAPTTCFNDATREMTRRLQDPKMVAILNSDYTTQPADTKELVAYLRKQTGGETRQFIYRDSTTLEKMVWNPGESKPVAFTKDVVGRGGAFPLFLYMPPDSRGVDFPVPQGEGLYAFAMIGVGIHADDFSQLLWRMRQFGMGQEVELAYDKKTEKHICEFLGQAIPPTGDTIRVGHVLRYVEHCTVKGDQLFDLKSVCARIRDPLICAVQDQLRKPPELVPEKRDSDLKILRMFMPGIDSLDNIGLGHYPLLEEFEGVLFRPHRQLMIHEEIIRWAQEYGVKREINRFDFVEKLLMSAIEEVRNTKSNFDDNLASFIEDRAINNHIKLEDRDRLFQAINQENAPAEWRVNIPLSVSQEQFVEAYKQEMSYAVSMNQIIRQARALKAGYADVEKDLLARLAEINEIQLRQFVYSNNVFPADTQDFMDAIFQNDTELTKWQHIRASGETKMYADSMIQMIHRGRFLVENGKGEALLEFIQGVFNKTKHSAIDPGTPVEKVALFYEANLPPKVVSSAEAAHGQEQQQEQQQEVEQEQQQEVEQVQEIQVQAPYVRSKKTYPLDFSAFAQGQEPVNPLYNQDSYQGAARQTFIRLCPNDNFPGYNEDFISQRAQNLIDRSGPQHAFPLCHILVVKLASGAYRSCLITAAEWEESIRSDMESSEAEASIYSMTACGFRRAPRMVMGSTARPLSAADELSSQFIAQQIRLKLWMDVPQFTPEEWDYLRTHIAEFKSDIEVLVPGIPRNSKSKRLLVQLQSNTMNDIVSTFELGLFMKIADTSMKTVDDLAENFVKQRLMGLYDGLNRFQHERVRRAYLKTLVHYECLALESYLINFLSDAERSNLVDAPSLRAKSRRQLLIALDKLRGQDGQLGHDEIFSGVYERLSAKQNLIGL